LTVWSFVDLRSAEDGAMPGGTAADGPDVAAVAEKGRALAQVEKPLADRLLETDLLAGENLPELQKALAASVFKPLKESWPRWVATRGAIEDALAAERLAAHDDTQSLATAARRMERLREKITAAGQESNTALTALLDERIAVLRRTLAERQRKSEAVARMGEIAAAFRAGQYDRCVTDYRQWLTDYGRSFDPQVVERVRKLELRAAFHADREKAWGRYKAAVTAAEQVAALGGFLQKYPDPGIWDSAERAVLTRCEETLRSLKEKEQAEVRDRAAEKSLAALRRNLPEQLGDRLAAAGAVLDRYPGTSAKPAMESEARSWIEECLPEKQLAEDVLLQEAETVGHEILRGFFRKVSLVGDAVGYKRYDSLEQFQHPTADVGTYRSEDLAQRPAASLPRRSLLQYQAARRRLLAEPGRKQSWVELAALCRALDDQLEQYRRKPGSSREPLRFEPEGKRIDEIVSAGWTNVEKLWRQ
jgi:hypothetical protein